MFALAEEFPHVGVGERGESGYLELEKVILGRVQIYGVDTAGSFETEGEDVVACGGDCEDDIIGGDFEKACISAVIFPRESVDVGVVEASVLGERLVVMDSPVVVLIPVTISTYEQSQQD